ncbi:MAG TPA: invasin domain 3-containing protein, partial [Gemmatimonadales bacterium]
MEPKVPDVQPAAALTSATIAQTLLASGHDPNNLKVYTTASIAPAPNALVTVAVLTHQSSSAAPAPTLTGGGMAAWDLVATTTFNGATPLDRVTIFRAMSATPGSGPISITSSVTVSNCQWIVSQWDGVETGGTNGAGAIVQTGATSGAAVNGLTVTLAAFADAADVGYGVFGIASATVAATAGTGFTRIDEQPSGEGTTGDLFAEWAVNDITVDATWSSKSAGALGVEIKAAGSSGGGGGGVSAALSTVSASPGSITAGGGTSTITVTAKDANGNAISGATVVLAATGTGNTLTQPAATTDANGVATGSLASTVAGAKTVSAKINGTSITQTATVTVTPGPVDASQSTLAAAPASVVPGALSTITVTAKDANGNPISGATVVLAATGMRTLTQPADTTGASGVTTGTVSGMMEETIIVSATVNGTAITQTATVEVVAQAAATITQ